MRIAAFGPAFLPLLAAWVLSSRAGTSRRGRWMVAAIDVLALLLAALLWNAGLGADLFSLFLSACVLGALTFAAVSPEQDIESLGLLHLGASLSIVAASTRELSWSVPAILLFGILVRQTRERRTRVLRSFRGVRPRETRRRCGGAPRRRPRGA